MRQSKGEDKVWVGPASDSLYKTQQYDTAIWRW